MHFINKGKPPKGGKYLVCDASRRLKTCTAKPIRYEEFEQLFFDNFEELDISQLIPGEDETQARINELEKLLTVNRQRLLEIDNKVENFSDTIGRTKDSRIREQLEKKLSQAFDDKERLESENKKFEREITELRQQKAGLEKDIEQAKEIYQILNSAQGEAERIELRLRLRQQIQKSIEWIKIYPLQEPYQEIQETEEPGIVKIMKSKYIDAVLKGDQAQVICDGRAALFSCGVRGLDELRRRVSPTRGCLRKGKKGHGRRHTHLAAT